MKNAIYIGLFIGSMIGGYVPSLFGAGMFTLWSIVGSTAGGILGIWAGFKISENY